MTHHQNSDRKLLAILLFLCLVPVLSGGYRLYSMDVNSTADAENLRYVGNPIPLAVHMIAYMFFCVFGTFQIAPNFRARRPKWHRIAGYLLIPAGLIAAGAGIWSTFEYDPRPGDGLPITIVRMSVAIGMIWAIVVGLTSIRRRDIKAHKIWMLRAYALSMGASTNAVIAAVWFATVGEPQGTPWALGMAAGWIFNLWVAERYANGRTISFSRPVTRLST